MQKRNNEYTISPLETDYRKDLLIVDAELLFTAKRKWLIKKTFEISDFNRKVIRYLNKISKNYDDITIVIVKDYKFGEKIVTTLLRLQQYSVLDIESESNYKNWLNIVQPVKHLAILKRRYYHRNSVYATEQQLIEK